MRFWSDLRAQSFTLILMACASCAPAHVQVSTLVYPANGAVGVDSTIPFQWTPVPGAQCYYLYVGSSPGAKDLHDSGEILTTSRLVPNLPVGPKTYARIHTKIAERWYYTDSSFTVSKTDVSTSDFVYPVDGSAISNLSIPIQWTSVSRAQCYYLYVGTIPGSKDLIDTGEIQVLSYPMPNLPPGKTAYARIHTKIDGAWYSRDAAFTIASQVYTPRSSFNHPLTRTYGTDPASSASSYTPAFVYPPKSPGSVDLSNPFKWKRVAGAQSYRLCIGSVLGAMDLYDSGEIHTTARYVKSLPLGRTVYAELLTLADGQSHRVNVSFRVVDRPISFERRLQTALSLTDQVRHMADLGNLPAEGTLLQQVVAARGHRLALCSDYANVLLQLLQEYGLEQARYLNVAFNSNGYDGHTLIELYNPEQQNWMLLDPTFDLSSQLTSNSLWATAADISAASRSRDWSAIKYKFLGDLGEAVACKYYLDYPLLYLNLYNNWGHFVPGHGYPLLEFLKEVPLPVFAAGAYVLRNNAVPQTTLWIDGSEVTVKFNGIDSTSQVISAKSISLSPVSSGGTQAFLVKRFVFR